MSNQPEVDEILEKFVTSFVTIFECYFEKYHETLVNRIPKTGKTAEALDGAAGIVAGTFEIFEGPIKAGAIIIFEVFRKTAGILGDKCYREDLKKLSSKLKDFKKRPDYLKEILVKSGIEIFRSFESQFTRLMADDNCWETAIEKVAEDVVNRIIHHLKNNPEKEFSVNTILEGVLFGESKTYRSFSTNLSNMHKGHSVIVKGENIVNKTAHFYMTTSDLFKKVGLLRDSDYYRYKSKSWSVTDLNRCGFRLLFTWEDVASYKNYTKLSQAPPDTYTYKLKDDTLERVQNDILNRVTDQQRTDNLENILEDMKTEASKATNELLVLLKQNSDAVRQISGEFEKIHERLDKIHETSKESNGLAKENRDILLDIQGKFHDVHKSLKNVTPDTVLFDIAEPSGLFTGRKAELKRLDESLQRSSNKKSVFSQMTCVSGLGGIGKSELAKQYVSDCKQKSQNQAATYSDFIWINADNVASLTNSFLRLAEEELDVPILNATGKPKAIERIVKVIYENLSCRSKCLIILDNAENQDYLRPFLPLRATTGSKPYFLLTSRDSEWDKRIEVLHLEAMTADDAVRFVESGLDNENECENIQLLVEMLQYFPLAIQQAISYILAQKELDEYTVGNYLEEFNTKTQKLLSSDIFKTMIMDNTNSKTTFTTWNITVDKICCDEEHGKLALDILNIMAYLSPENIHREMFFGLPEFGEDDVKRAVRLLVKYSMARGELHQKVLKIHRLVQQVTRIRLDDENESEGVIKAVQMIFKINVPEDDPSSESYVTKRKMLPHLEAFYAHLKDWIARKPADQEKIERTFLIDLLLRLGNACSNLGESWRAKQVYEDTLAILRKRNGKDDLISTAIVSVSLCPVLDDLGDYKEQLRIIEEVLPILEQYYNGDSRFASALEKKAAALSKLGECEKAEEIFNQCLQIHETYCDALNIANTKLNLSVIYGLKNDVQKQKTTLQEALSIYEKNYKSDHITVASARFQLATVYGKLGDFNTEIELYEKCRPVFESVYGESQNVARLWLLLGVAYGKKGDREKDKEYSERALHIFKNHYRNEHHIDVARCVSHLADVIGDLGDKREKLNLLTSALVDYEAFYEGGSWDTAYLLVQIAGVEDELGQREESKEALQRAVSMMESHPRNREGDHEYVNKLKRFL